MSRQWCPSLQSESSFSAWKASDIRACRPTHAEQNFSKELGAVAASSDKFTSEFVSSVRERVATHCKSFGASVVLSHMNKALWPTGLSSGPLKYTDALKPKAGTLVALASALLVQVVNAETVVESISLPSDEMVTFLDHVARTEAKSKTCRLSANLKCITLLPSIAALGSSESIFSGLHINHELMSSLEAFCISGVSSGDEQGVADFIEQAKRLTSFCAVRCLGRNEAQALFETLKEKTLEYLSVEGNDLGASPLDDMAEEITTALGELLKSNKFLAHLNLAFTNLSPDQVYEVMEQLANSDTKLLPEDLPQEEEEEEVAVEDLIAYSIFGVDGEEDEESEEETQEEGEEGEQGSPEDSRRDAEEVDDAKESDETASDEEGEEEVDDEEDENRDKDPLSHSDDEEGDEEDDEEDEDEEEEGMPKVDPRIERMYRRLFNQLLRAEVKERREHVRLYLEETLVTAGEIDRIRIRAREEKENRIAEFCKRRSGWSHLESLILRGNRVGDRGAAAVALLLRDTVALEEEEITQIEETLQGYVDKELDLLRERCRETLLEERSERGALSKEMRTALKELAPLASNASFRERRTTFVEVGSNESENDESESLGEAPSIVMTNVDGDQSQYAVSDNDEEGNFEELEALEEKGEWPIPILPTKSAMKSLRFLDLGSCEIGSRGLKKLAATLSTNEILETLILRNNRFGAMFTKAAPDSHLEDEEGAMAEREEVLNYVSPGILALADALRVNKALKHIDLGYCQLLPESIQVLAVALTGNTSLSSLGLEGNRMDVVGNTEEAAVAHPSSALLALLRAVGCCEVKYLNLGHNNLGDLLWEEELEAMAAVSLSLHTLKLSSVGLSARHLVGWSRALGHKTPTLRCLHLSRNHLDCPGDGYALRDFLSHCTDLEELCVSEHPLWGSHGLALALASAPPTLRRLSCDNVGATSAVYEESGSPVLPQQLLRQLEYLSLSDMSVDTLADLERWTTYLGENGEQLCSLSLWSRKLDMEGNLEPLRCMVESLPNLLYIDFGVLLRFDMPPDMRDGLGLIEKTLLERRLACTARDQA